MLFPGTSNYPLSPHEIALKDKSSMYVEEEDLIFKICEQINVDKEKDLSFLTDEG